MHIYGQFIFDLDATAVQWGNEKYLQQMVLEKVDKYMENLDLLSYHIQIIEDGV